MRRMGFLLIGLTIAFASVTFAQSSSEQEVVSLQLTAHQLTPFDAGNDTYTGSVDDRLARTELTVRCNEGGTSFLVLRTDEACNVSGTGYIKNPNDPSDVRRRIDYSGGFTVEAGRDGYADATNLRVNYIAVGTAGSSSTTFGGHFIKLPENPPQSAVDLGRRVVQSLQQQAGGGAQVEYSTQIDSIQFVEFTLPHVGHAGSTSCSWTGDWIYSYASESWHGAFDVTCGNESFRLEGSMPWIDEPDGSTYDAEYQINLIVPGAGSGDPFAAPDPFASVDGITGTLGMTNSGRSTEDGVYETIEVEGELVATGLPQQLLHDWARIIVLHGRTFFGE